MLEKPVQGDVYDPSVIYVRHEPKVNTMNEIDPEKLAKYLDPEFYKVTPDSKTKDAGQLEIEDKEKMDMEFDLDEDLEEEIEKANLQAAILTPREYQYELYQKALVENVIVVLDTGAGKTLISIMLIKQMVLTERQERLSRIEVYCIMRDLFQMLIRTFFIDKNGFFLS